MPVRASDCCQSPTIAHAGSIEWDASLRGDSPLRSPATASTGSSRARTCVASKRWSRLLERAVSTSSVAKSSRPTPRVVTRVALLAELPTHGSRMHAPRGHRAALRRCGDLREGRSMASRAPRASLGPGGLSPAPGACHSYASETRSRLRPVFAAVPGCAGTALPPDLNKTAKRSRPSPTYPGENNRGGVMLDQHAHLRIQNQNSELREIAPRRPRLDRPEYRRRSRLRTLLDSVARTPVESRARA